MPKQVFTSILAFCLMAVLGLSNSFAQVKESSANGFLIQSTRSIQKAL